MGAQTMTPDQIGLVEQSFQMVRPMQGQAAGLFYRRLFEIAPETTGLFADANMTRQALRFMGTLNLLVSLMRQPANLERAATELAARHGEYGVTQALYTPFGEALLWTLEQCLGAAYDHETREAWAAGYSLIATAMTGATPKLAKAG